MKHALFPLRDFPFQTQKNAPLEECVFFIDSSKGSLGVVVSMKQLVSLFASGFTEELSIESLDVGVLVRKTQSLLFILGVDTFHALFKERGIAVEEGLSAAVDTTAGAGHDFNSLEAVGILTDHVKHLAGVTQTGADSHVDGFSGSNLNRGFFDAVKSADSAEVDGVAFQILAVEHVVDGTAGSLKHTAGNAEDVGGAGGLTQGAVKLIVIHVGKVDTGFAEHLAEFAGGDNVVHIADAVLAELGTGGLVLLGLAGHDGNNHQISGLHADLLSIVALGDGAEHLLGRFAAGRNVEQIGVVVLDEVDPAGAAAGQDGQVLAALDALNDLGALFHDGEVSGEVGIKDLVKAQSAESGNHLAGDRSTGLKAEFLTHSHADGGSSLHDNSLGGVVDGGPDFFHIADTGDGTHGADVDTLSAEGTVGFSQGDHAGGTDLGGKSAAVTGQGADGLNFVTDGLAAAAHDALGKVAHDGFAGGVRLKTVLGAGEGDLFNAELSSEHTQFAVLVLGAGQTLLGVVTEHKLKNGAAGIESALAVGVDHHAFHNRSGTGGSQIAAAFNFDHADTAAGRLVGNAAAEFVPIAEGRDLDIELTGGVQNGGTGRYSDLFPIDGKIDSIHCCTHFLTIAFLGHPPIQAPHLIHLAVSMT